jgi:hypothetical protein
MIRNYVSILFSVYHTPKPYHNQHILTYFPFNQLDTRSPKKKKKEAAVKGEVRVNVYIFGIDHSVNKVQLMKLVMEDDSSKRNYRTQLRFDPYNDVKNKYKSVEIIRRQDT